MTEVKLPTMKRIGKILLIWYSTLIIVPMLFVFSGSLPWYYVLSFFTVQMTTIFLVPQFGDKLEECGNFRCNFIGHKWYDFYWSHSEQKFVMKKYAFKNLIELWSGEKMVTMCVRKNCNAQL